MSLIREIADIAQQTSVLLGFDSPDSLLSLLQKMLEVSDPPTKVIEDVRAELRATETRAREHFFENKSGPPPTHLAPMVRLSDPPPPIAPQLAEILGRQQRAVDWVNSRLGAWSMAPAERARRFFEEAVELAQAAGCSVEDARRTVDYVFARPAGDAAQEVGGARLTLLALAASLGVNALEAEAAELARVYALPVERFRQRDDEKRAAGICAPASDPPGTYYPYEGSLPCIELLRLSDTPPTPSPRSWPDTRVSRRPGDIVRFTQDGAVFDLNFAQACSLVEDITAAQTPICWGEGHGPHPGEVVLAQSHPGSRRAAVRPVEGGIALRAVECDGQPAGGSIFLRDSAIDNLIEALKGARSRIPAPVGKPVDRPWKTIESDRILGEPVPDARYQTDGKGWRVTFEDVVMSEGDDFDEVIKTGRQAIRAIELRRADPQLAELVEAGLTSFLPAVLTARRCSASHLQLLDEGVVTANWWPSTGKARAEGPTGGVAAPTKIKTVPELVAWLKGL